MDEISIVREYASMPASRRSFASRSQRWPRTLWSAEVPHPKAYRVHLGRTCRSTSQPIDTPGASQTACGAPCPRATVLRSSERESAQDAHGHRDAPCDGPPPAHVKEQSPHRERASHAPARILPGRPSEARARTHPRAIADSRWDSRLPSQPSRARSSGSRRAPEWPRASRHASRSASRPEAVTLSQGIFGAGPRDESSASYRRVP